MESFIITRHGETQESLDDIVQGQSNTKLTENGRNMSLSLGKYLSKSYYIARIITSDLRRSFETAKLIALNIFPHPKIQIEPLLRELSSGVYEQRPFTELDSFRYSDFRGMNNARPIGGESLNDMRDRVLNWFSSFILGSVNNTLIVTHKGPISEFLESCSNFRDFPSDSTMLKYKFVNRT